MRNDDLVTLAEAERELGLNHRTLRQIDQRLREGANVDMPPPALVGRSVRLWSMRELQNWWPTRTRRTRRPSGIV